LVSPTPGGVIKVPRTVVDIPHQVGINRIGALAINPTDPNVIYVGTGDPEWRGGAGVLVSINGGSNWLLTSDLFAGTSIAKIIIDPTDPTRRRLFAAIVPQDTSTSTPADGGLFFSPNGGIDWVRQNANFLSNPPVTAVLPYDLAYLVLPGARLRLIAALSPKYAWKTGYNTDDSGIWISDNYGGAWTKQTFGVIQG
jgi:hypothetical protein